MAELIPQEEFASADATVQFESGKTAGAADSGSDETPAGLKVLLTEDNPVNQLTATTMLKKLGHQVDVANNGLEALEQLAGNDYDVVFMDVQMPEMDGMTATARIREDEKTSGKHIPIIAMTAHAMQGDREKCLEGGMDEYVSKPIRRKDLKAVIERITERFLQ